MNPIPLNQIEAQFGTTFASAKRRFADLIAPDPTFPVGDALSVSEAQVGHDRLDLQRGDASARRVDGPRSGDGKLYFD